MKLIVLSILGALILLGCSAQKIELQNEKEYEIVLYFNIPENGFNKLKEISDSAPTPEMKSFFAYSLKYFNKQEYGQNVANYFNSKLSREEINYIHSYIQSSQGTDTKALFKNITNPTMANSVFESFSNENKAAVNNFFESSSGKALATLFSSPEFSGLNKSYGELLVCRYMSEHRKSEFESIKVKGKCLNI